MNRRPKRTSPPTSTVKPLSERTGAFFFAAQYVGGRLWGVAYLHRVSGAYRPKRWHCRAPGEGGSQTQQTPPPTPTAATERTPRGVSGRFLMPSGQEDQGNREGSTGQPTGSQREGGREGASERPGRGEGGGGRAGPGEREREGATSESDSESTTQPQPQPHPQTGSVEHVRQGRAGQHKPPGRPRVSVEGSRACRPQALKVGGHTEPPIGSVEVEHVRSLMPGGRPDVSVEHDGHGEW